jgi:hypothetical protein
MFLVLTFTLGNEGPTTQLGFVLGNSKVEVRFNLKIMSRHDIVESMVPSNLKFDNWISIYIMMCNVHKFLMSFELQWHPWVLIHITIFQALIFKLGFVNHHFCGRSCQFYFFNSKKSNCQIQILELAFVLKGVWKNVL